MRLIVTALALLLAVILAVQNTAIVDVSLLFWNLRASLAIIIALCLVLGLLLGLAAVSPLIFRDRRSIRQLETRLAAMQTENNQTTVDPAGLRRAHAASAEGDRRPESRSERQDGYSPQRGVSAASNTDLSRHI